MSVTLSGKDKAARVPLGYYHASGKDRRFWAVVVAALLLVGAGVAWGVGYWKTAAMPGPVQAAHAAWENDCTSCHAVLTPTGSSNAFQIFGSARGHTSDQLCMKCHMGLDSEKHHSNQIDSQVGTCASCHRDHAGRDAFISRVHDGKCTSCHGDLKNHVADKEKAPSYAEKVTLFERDHPHFSVGPEGKRRKLSDVQAAKEDPGRLRFNHEQHLAEGIQVDWTFEKIPDKKLRQRYLDMQERLTGTKPAPTDKMKLDCAACHRLDATDDPGRNGPFRTSGEYMLPVTYEQHCRACHPLTFSTLAPETEIPHHMTPAQVKEFLWGVFTDKALKDEKVRAKVLGDRPLPGANLPREELDKWKLGFRGQLEKQVSKAEKVAFAPDLERARKALNEDQVDRTAQFVFLGKATCRLCHYYEGPAGSAVPEAITPTKVPEVWLPHSKFSHRAHRTMKCAECHENVERSLKSGDVLLPDVDNCKQCHSTARTENGVKKGGVRQDCATCHRYHHGDVPLAGRGAAARGVKERVGALEWLKGK